MNLRRLLFMPAAGLCLLALSGCFEEAADIRDGVDQAQETARDAQRLRDAVCDFDRAAAERTVRDVVQEPIRDLSMRYNQVQAAMAASERVFATLDAQPERGGTRRDECVANRASTRLQASLVTMTHPHARAVPQVAEVDLRLGEDIAYVTEDRATDEESGDVPSSGRFPAGHGAGEPGDDLGRVGFARRECFRPAGVLAAGVLEVVGVKGFVSDKRVGAVAPRAHHRGRDVPRPGPHADADGVAGHGAVRPATSVSTSSR